MKNEIDYGANVRSNDQLGPLPEMSGMLWEFKTLRGRQPFRYFSAEDMRAYAAQELAAERERLKTVMEDRCRIHAESSHIYERLAGAVRAGAEDIVLGQLLRNEVMNRA